MAKQIREIRVIDLILYYYLTLAIIIILTAIFVFALIAFEKIAVKAILVMLFITAMYFTLKYHAIGCVLMYKAFAPLDVRDRCRFQPTCSTYMIMAIKKYGLIKGTFKGLKRIFKCKPPNGGIDLP